MIRKTLSVALCAASFVYTFYVACNFTYFLSNHNESQKFMLRSSRDESLGLTTIWTLLFDACLLSAFILQHSIMASDAVKKLYKRFEVQEIERSVYNVGTATVIHFLIGNWRPAPWATLWNVNTFYDTKLWLLFTTIHVLAWFIIYSGCVMMDISELMGLKQIYYKISGRETPMSMKCKELQRLYSHMRHPSFTGFFIILWIHPFMSVDRCLLAGLLTVYMILMWTIDQKDLAYHNSVVRIKHQELK